MEKGDKIWRCQCGQYNPTYLQSCQCCGVGYYEQAWTTQDHRLIEHFAERFKNDGLYQIKIKNYRIGDGSGRRGLYIEALFGTTFFNVTGGSEAPLVR